VLFDCPYQKVHLVADQHISLRDLNTARAVGSLCRSADRNVGPQVFLARVKSKGADQMSG
jgi:hypothetical protein